MKKLLMFAVVVCLLIPMQSFAYTIVISEITTADETVSFDFSDQGSGTYVFSGDLNDGAIKGSVSIVFTIEAEEGESEGAVTVGYSLFSEATLADEYLDTLYSSCYQSIRLGYYDEDKEKNLWTSEYLFKSMDAVGDYSSSIGLYASTGEWTLDTGTVYKYSIVLRQGAQYVSGEGWSGNAEGTSLGSLTLTVPSAVPVPGAVWLLGSGLVGLAGLRRSRK